MRYELRVTAFDMLDKIHVGVVLLRQGDEPGAPSLPVGTRVSTQQGTGESEPWLWARDALVQAIESL